ncbi:hypothetical protein SDJN03_19207, partial [Cucurbita argyrosperma subsp. sororia]
MEGMCSDSDPTRSQFGHFRVYSFLLPTIPLVCLLPDSPLLSMPFTEMGITDVLESTTALDSSSTAVDASRFLRRRPSATTGGDEYDKNLRPNIRGSDSSPPDHASFNGLLAAKSSEEVKDRNDAIENPNLMEPEKDPVTRPRVEEMPFLLVQPLPVFSLSSFLVEKMAMQKHMFEPGNNCSFGWISTVYIITRRLLTEIVIITTVAVLHPVFMILRSVKVGNIIFWFIFSILGHCPTVVS